MKLENIRISFSGEMEKEGIYEMAQEAIKLGAKWDSDVSSDTNILVKGMDYIEKKDEQYFEKNSRLMHDHNVEQPKGFKTEIISENDFYKLIKE